MDLDNYTIQSFDDTLMSRVKYKTELGQNTANFFEWILLFPRINTVYFTTLYMSFEYLKLFLESLPTLSYLSVGSKYIRVSKLQGLLAYFSDLTSLDGLYKNSVGYFLNMIYKTRYYPDSLTDINCAIFQTSDFYRLPLQLKKSTVIAVLGSVDEFDELPQNLVTLSMGLIKAYDQTGTDAMLSKLPGGLRSLSYNSYQLSYVVLHPASLPTGLTYLDAPSFTLAVNGDNLAELAALPSSLKIVRIKFDYSDIGTFLTLINRYLPNLENMSDSFFSELANLANLVEELPINSITLPPNLREATFTYVNPKGIRLLLSLLPAALKSLIIKSAGFRHDVSMCDITPLLPVELTSLNIQQDIFISDADVGILPWNLKTLVIAVFTTSSESWTQNLPIGLEKLHLTIYYSPPVPSPTSPTYWFTDTMVYNLPRGLKNLTIKNGYRHIDMRFTVTGFQYYPKTLVVLKIPDYKPTLEMIPYLPQNIVSVQFLPDSSESFVPVRRFPAATLPTQSSDNDDVNGISDAEVSDFLRSSVYLGTSKDAVLTPFNSSMYGPIIEEVVRTHRNLLNWNSLTMNILC